MICRLCLISINTEDSVLLFDAYDGDGETQLIKIIAKYLHLEITRQDEISTRVCRVCSNQFTEFHKYCAYVEQQQSALSSKFLVVEYDNQINANDVRSELQEPMEVQLKCEPEDELLAEEATEMRNEKDDILYPSIVAESSRMPYKQTRNQNTSTQEWSSQTATIQTSNEATTHLLLPSNCYQSGDLLQDILNNANQIINSIQLYTTANKALELRQRVNTSEQDNIKMNTPPIKEVNTQQETIDETKLLTLIPRKPFVNIAELEAFEKKLGSSTALCCKLERDLLRFDIPLPSRFLRSIWKTFLTDELAFQCCWKGTSKKKCVVTMSLTSIIRGVFHRKFDSGEKIFKKISAKWFHTANDRLKYIKKNSN